MWQTDTLHQDTCGLNNWIDNIRLSSCITVTFISLGTFPFYWFLWLVNRYILSVSHNIERRLTYLHVTRASHSSSFFMIHWTLRKLFIGSLWYMSSTDIRWMHEKYTGTHVALMKPETGSRIPMFLYENVSVSSRFFSRANIIAEISSVEPHIENNRDA